MPAGRQVKEKGSSLRGAPKNGTGEGEEAEEDVGRERATTIKRSKNDTHTLP